MITRMLRLTDDPDVQMCLALLPPRSCRVTQYLRFRFLDDGTMNELQASCLGLRRQIGSDLLATDSGRWGLVMIGAVRRGALMAAVMMTPCFAADMPAKAPSLAAAPAWSGFYLGATVGGRWSKNSWTGTDVAPSIGGITPDPNPTGPFDSTAVRWGGVAGYNWTFASAGLIGIEADVGGGSKSASALAPGTNATQGVALAPRPTGTVTAGWDGSLRARLGLVVNPRTLIFGTGGVAWQHIKLAASCVVGTFCNNPHDDTATTTRAGWTVGGGIEHRLDAHWIVRADYRYADFGTFTHEFFTTPLFLGAADDRFTAHVKTQTHTVNAAIVYKF